MIFEPTEKTEAIDQYRAEFYRTINAPVDAMWEILYIGNSQHYLIQWNGADIGYCCINEKRCLTQVFVEAKYNPIMDQVIQELIAQSRITSASLSSKETLAFNACLHLSTKIKANTLCFEHNNIEVEEDETLLLTQAKPNDIPAIQNFLKEQIGFIDDFGYTENLVKRSELYFYKDSGELVATSECRLSESQPQFADLGIIVNRDHQRKGIATKVMRKQANRVIRMGRKPICSTTVENIASKKAIEKSGFYCSNIIFDMNFQKSKDH